MLYALILLTFMGNKGKLLFDFSTESQVQEWQIVNDGVMGGLSQSKIDFLKQGYMHFSGHVSLDNYGGFASTRTFAKDYQISNKTKGISIRIKGDGQRYKFRLRTNNNFDGVAYSIDFTTTKGEWQVFFIPFHKMQPTFRGRIQSNYPALSPSNIRQLGILIADKQQGEFNLTVDWIRAIAHTN